jgi:hypothetical protein
MLISNNNRKIKGLPFVLLLLAFLLVQVIPAQASVGLLYFRAQSGPDFIMLEWETAQELDNFV